MGKDDAFRLIEETAAALAFLAVCFFAVVMHPVLP